MRKNRRLLSAVILDLNYGYLSIGGLTSIGRGMFKVTNIFINGENRTEYLNAENIDKLLKSEA